MCVLIIDILLFHWKEIIVYRNDDDFLSIPRREMNYYITFDTSEELEKPEMRLLLAMAKHRSH